MLILLFRKKSNETQDVNLVDNRSEVVTQRKLQEMSNNIPQVKKNAQLRAMLKNNSAPFFQKKDVSLGETSSSNTTIQLNRDDIELTPIRARTATCRTIGVQHEDGKSFASVGSIANSLQETDSVVYEIAWDAAVAPVGHKGMDVVEGQASDFIVDRSQEGESIGENRRHYNRDESSGLYSFCYNDGIEWPTDLNGGEWRFRLRVVNGAGTQVACSDVAIVDWNHG